MLRRTAAMAALVVATLGTAPALAQDWVVDTLLRADLHGDSEMNGHVRWVERHNTHTANGILIVKVMDAEPGEDLDVFVNGEFATTVVVDSNGLGLAHLPNPLGLETPERLDTVEVGPLTGVFFDRHPARPLNNIQRYILRTRAHGDSVSAVIRYVERLKRNNIVQTFSIEVAGEYTEDLEVRINGELVAMIQPPADETPSGSDVVSDSAGGRRPGPPNDGGGDNGLVTGEDGRLLLQTQFAVRGGAQPLPTWFPTLLPGDVISVGPATGELIWVDWTPPNN